MAPLAPPLGYATDVHITYTLSLISSTFSLSTVSSLFFLVKLASLVLVLLNTGQTLVVTNMYIACLERQLIVNHQSRSISNLEINE